MPEGINGVNEQGTIPMCTLEDRCGQCRWLHVCFSLCSRVMSSSRRPAVDRVVGVRELDFGSQRASACVDGPCLLLQRRPSCCRNSRSAADVLLSLFRLLACSWAVCVELQGSCQMFAGGTPGSWCWRRSGGCNFARALLAAGYIHCCMIHRSTGMVFAIRCSAVVAVVVLQ